MVTHLGFLSTLNVQAKCIQITQNCNFLFCQNSLNPERIYVVKHPFHLKLVLLEKFILVTYQS